MVLPDASSPEPPATGSAMTVRPLLLVLGAQGVDVPGLLARFGIAPSSVTDPEGRLSNEAIKGLWEAAPVLSGDPDIGLRVAMLYRPGTFRVLDYVVATAPDLRSAIERTGRYLRILHDLADLELVEEGDRATLTCTPSSNIGSPPAQSEFLMASMILVARSACASELAPLEVRFRHAAPADPALARSLFRCPVHYGRDALSAVLSRSHLDLPCAGADPVLAEVVGGHADTILGRLSPENPLSHLVRRAISLSLAEGPTLDGVAATMHTSGRTLRRRLAGAGTSFQQLLDEVRAELARRYLRDHRLSIDEVGLLLGFANTPAFHRAFKRWTGATPAAFRVQGAGAETA